MCPAFGKALTSYPDRTIQPSGPESSADGTGLLDLLDELGLWNQAIQPLRWCFLVDTTMLDRRGGLGNDARLSNRRDEILRLPSQDSPTVGIGSSFSLVFGCCRFTSFDPVSRTVTRI